MYIYILYISIECNEIVLASVLLSIFGPKIKHFNTIDDVVIKTVTDYKDI